MKLSKRILKDIINEVIEETSFNVPGESYWNRQEKLQGIVDDLYSVIKDMYNNNDDSSPERSLIKSYVFKKGNITDKQLNFLKNLIKKNNKVKPTSDKEITDKDINSFFDEIGFDYVGNSYTTKEWVNNKRKYWKEYYNEYIETGHKPKSLVYDIFLQYIQGKPLSPKQKNAAKNSLEYDRKSNTILQNRLNSRSRQNRNTRKLEYELGEQGIKDNQEF